jgi:hypothetical protein
VDTLVYEVLKGLDAEFHRGTEGDREAIKRLKESHAIYKIVMCAKLCLEEALKRADATNGPPFKESLTPVPCVAAYSCPSQTAVLSTRRGLARCSYDAPSTGEGIEISHCLQNVGGRP